MKYKKWQTPEMMSAIFILHRAILVSSDMRYARKVKLASMKNKSLRRIAAAQRGRCFAPCAARQER